jgi:RHS repeat-associated protein
VVAETDGAGALRAYYVRGDDLLALMRPLVPVPATAADWQTRCYHADGIGSVRALTDETGAVTDSYTYTAFGELLEHTGTDPQPYAFAGEPYDPNAGFQYHRARWMDPRVGRFLGMDPFGGSPQDPPTLHLYLYARVDPINKIDPTGRFFILAALVGSRVHHHIGEDFRQKGRNRFANYTPVHIILGIGPGDCVAYAGIKPERICGLKPDLVDGDTHEVYEIKPQHALAAGYLELGAYIGVLDMNDPRDRPWHEGTTYRPPSHFVIPELGGWDVYVDPPLFGVIGYRAYSQTGNMMAAAGIAFGISTYVMAQLAKLAANATRAGQASLNTRVQLAQIQRF